jgi:hypothetical protein
MSWAIKTWEIEHLKTVITAVQPDDADMEHHHMD